MEPIQLFPHPGLDCGREIMGAPEIRHFLPFGIPTGHPANEQITFHLIPYFSDPSFNVEEEKTLM